MSISQKNVIYPHSLSKGDTIGIVAPAGPFDRHLFDQGVSIIRGMGFAIRIDEQLFSRNGYLAGADSARTAHFNAMVADDKVRALICARGGYGSLRMLTGLDYEKIRQAAKPVIGFSDITALHRAILLKSGLVTFHGPMVTTLAGIDDDSRNRWYDTLTDPVPAPMKLSGVRVLKPGFARGMLAGGNLATLCHLTGTWVAGSLKGSILLLEDVGEAVYRIDRMLTQLKMADMFEGLTGVVLGEFKNCGPAEQIEDLFMQIFGDRDIPIVSGAPVGHGSRNWTVPMGIQAVMDTDREELRFLLPAVRE